MRLQPEPGSLSEPSFFVFLVSQSYVQKLLRNPSIDPAVASLFGVGLGLGGAPPPVPADFHLLVVNFHLPW